MRIASVKTVREIEKLAIEKHGIPEILLMENAAHAFVSNMDLSKDYFVVVCGVGNNGGDGLSVSRLLASRGKQVDVFIVGEEKKMSELFRKNLSIIENYGVNITYLKDTDSSKKDDIIWNFEEAIQECDMVIDAIYGTGFRGGLEPLTRDIIEIINRNRKYVMSVDVPSGLIADTGEVPDIAVKADSTVTFIMYKRGFVNYEAIEYTGKVIVDSIGISPKLIDELSSTDEIVEMNLITSLIPVRKRTGYKGNYGKVLIVAGSPGFKGANRITTEACIATGAGLVTVSSHKNVFPEISKDLLEAMSVDPDKIENAVSASDVIAFGPGMGNSKDTNLLLLRIIKKLREEGKSDATLILDADGLNILEGKADILENIGVKVVITPHLGEMAKLTGHTIEYVQKNRIELARKFAKKHKVTVVLKGYYTIITDGERLYINPTGSSAIASGGMGDCLTGIIAGMSGQMSSSFEASVFGVFLHGHIGDVLAADRYAVSAREIIEKIPFEMKNILQNKISRD